jgi:threonine dehydratase
MTPLAKLGSVYLKREDLNLTGSAKDRAVKLQIKNLQDLQYPSAVISSTGNAAISADYFCHQNHIPLTVFVSPNVNPQKLALITHSQIITTDKPISEAFKFSKSNQSYFLRQSTDPVALTGYSQISEEIMKDLPKITSIFIPVGSGSTLLGISQKLPSTVKIFAVQPASNCPIASVFDTNFTPETTSLTDALTAKLLPLKHKVISAIKKSGGSGLVVQNSEVVKYHQYLKSQNITTSPEGALAYAGYLQAQKTFDIGQFPVILLTGAQR